MAATLSDIGHESRGNVMLLTKSPNSTSAHPWNRDGRSLRGAQVPWEDVRAERGAWLTPFLDASYDRDGTAI